MGRKTLNILEEEGIARGVRKFPYLNYKPKTSEFFRNRSTIRITFQVALEKTITKNSEIYQENIYVKHLLN